MKKLLVLFAIFLFSINSSLAETIKFIQVSDVHYPNEKRLEYEGRSLKNAKPNFQKTIHSINKTDIDFVFFTGDLVDQSQKELFDGFFAELKNLNKKYFLCLGNHDSNSPNGLTKTGTLNYIKENKHYQKANGNYTVNLNDDFLAIVLDGSHDTKMTSRGYFTKETTDWLKETLKTNKDKNIVIFQHFPIVEPKKDESYFHKHSTIKKRAYIRLLKQNPNIVGIFSGHYHIAGELEKYGTKHFSTPALFTTPAFYRTVEIDYNKQTINHIKTHLIEL
jgi:3',5'-cyclic AMP phosphodiesterase CpdA